VCGRYSLTSPVEGIRALFGFDELPNLGLRYNIAPTQDVPIVRGALDGRSEFATMRWGLVPSWAKEVGGSAPLINARAETLSKKPSFRDAFRKRRCLIPADGFYEWKSQGGGKQAYRIAMPDDAPFAFAGIWESWQDAQGEALESCAIITTEASEELAVIHHRMPVILPPERYGDWLEAPMAALLRPYEGVLRAYAVGASVNKVANDNPALWDEVAPHKVPTQLDLL
jgi:putative SOS response-associated peptidase YedK